MTISSETCWSKSFNFPAASGPSWTYEQNQTSVLRSPKQRTKMSPRKTETVKMDRAHSLTGFIYMHLSIYHCGWPFLEDDMVVVTPTGPWLASRVAKNGRSELWQWHSISWARAKLKSPEVYSKGRIRWFSCAQKCGVLQRNEQTNSHQQQSNATLSYTSAGDNNSIDSWICVCYVLGSQKISHQGTNRGACA